MGEGTGLRIQSCTNSLIFRGADGLTGSRNARRRTGNLIKFPFPVMLRISPIPLVPVKIPLILMRIWILPVLLRWIKSGTCLLPVSQSVHPREAIPAKLFHGSEFVWEVHPFPTKVRIPVTNFVQQKSIDKHGGHQRIGNKVEQIESTGFGTQGKNMHIERLQTHMIIFVNGAHFFGLA